MKLSAPKQITWIIALLLGILGILGGLDVIPAIAGYAIWLVAAALVLLLVATTTKGL